MQIRPPSIQLRHYPEAYQHISKKLDELGLQEIGDPNYREKQDRFKDKNGEVRAGSIDLSREGRVSRTCLIMEISTEQMDRLHVAEKKKGYFISLIRQFFRQDYKQILLNSQRIDAVHDFQEKYRPEPLKFHGVSIPPYFPPDNEFDGLEYHHAWDKTIYANKYSLVLPETSSRRERRVLSDD